MIDSQGTTERAHKNERSSSTIGSSILGKGRDLSDSRIRWINITKDNGSLIRSMYLDYVWLFVSLANGTSEGVAKNAITGLGNGSTEDHAASSVRDSLVIVACIVVIGMITLMSWRRSVRKKRYLHYIILTLSQRRVTRLQDPYVLKLVQMGKATRFHKKHGSFQRIPSFSLC